MVRGAAKADAQKKNAAKQQAVKGSQLGARTAALTFVCPKCKASAPSYKTMVSHFEGKHPKDPVPTEASFTA